MDEADKLFSPDCQPLIEQILKFLPSERQISLFSAAFAFTVKDFRDCFLNPPYEINLREQLTLEGVSQYCAFVEEHPKIHCLEILFTKLQINEAIILCNSVKPSRTPCQEDH